ncbi:ABC transporter permease subunit [Kineococcus aurantiacus]|uniref:Multiple sugar transport system permease protein n=1 Tax=Kineococcus aurantiacus TaxID=37633 RepID=A0A7Y9DHP1_9ACTN|nr:multiple sugar transport system permease protein [Kineococcus aurantiacus]
MASTTSRPAPGATSSAPRGPALRRPGRAGRGRRASLDLVGWGFVLPFVLVFAVFSVAPAAMALFLSLTDIGIGDLTSPFAVDVVGLGNYTGILRSEDFQRAMLNTALFVVVGVPVTMGAGFVLALALDSGIRRLRSVFRAVVYVPVIANVVAAAVLWQYAFTREGPVNGFLGALGVDGPNWLGRPGWAVVAVLLLTVWRNIGTCMVLFLAGLQSVPEEVHEAAALDGAGYWRRVTAMTVPLLRPTTLLVSVLMSVSFLNIFDEPYLVTDGGPLSATTSVAKWVYDQFGYGRIADSMAGSMVLLVVVLVVSTAQVRLLRSKH